MRKIGRIVFGLLLACCATSAQAQTYPDRPIRLIVSIAAGSVTDVIMRKAAAELQPRLGQPLVIENRGGASGIVAAQACAQAAPDGYTLCVIYHSTMSYNPLLFDKLPYDRRTRPGAGDAAVLSHRRACSCPARSGVNSVAELKALAQSETRQAQLRHARRRIVSRPVPALAEQPVGHKDRRRALQRRRPGRAGARRQ